jgi:hypothetical protein
MLSQSSFFSKIPSPYSLDLVNRFCNFCLMGKILQKKTLKLAMHLLVIAAVCLFNFSSVTAAALCEINSSEDEDCCCVSHCASAKEISITETVSKSCECIVQIADVQTNKEKTLVPTHHKNYFHIAKILVSEFTENRFDSGSAIHESPGKTFSIQKDICLLNSVLRI